MRTACNRLAGLLLCATVALIVLVPTASAGAPPLQPVSSGASWDLLGVAQTELLAPDGAVWEWFGRAVAISGTTAVIGAYDHLVTPDGTCGAAYVFVRSSGVWTFQQELHAPDPGSGDDVGYAVAISGDTVLVGAPGSYNPSAVTGGAVFVFTRSGTAWTYRTILYPGDGTTGDRFGANVALDGTTAVVGAPERTVGGKTSRGAAYIFSGSGSTWTQQPDLTAGDGAASDSFGSSVAVSGDTVAVGAFGHAGGGAAYIFTRSGSSWAIQQELHGVDTAPGNSFGFSVGVSGDYAIVGAPQHTHVSAAYDGAAYVFSRTGTTWTQQREFVAADAAPNDNLGYGVALSGDVAVAGAPEHTSGGVRSGVVYVYARLGSSWVQQPTLLPVDAAADEWFGGTVAASDGSVLAGAACHATYTGAAYPFQLDATPPVTSVAGIPAGWSSAPVSVTLTAVDDLWGVASTEYRLQGAPAWTSYSTPFQVTTQGSSTYEYRSTDKVGNVEASKSFTVRIDTSAPTTTASGVPAGWSKTAVITLSGSDAYSGRASTEYRLQGAASWTTYAAPFAVTAQGTSTWEFRSTDVVGNVETAKTLTAKVDAKGPQTLALAKVSVKKGKKVSFRFRINDLTPTAAVTIKIYKGKKLKKTVTVGSKATNSAQSYKWSCKLVQGSYIWKVYATDLAGNLQTTVGSKTLVVK
jgi:hypothetical protein